MNIHVPRGMLVSTVVLCCLAFVGLMVRQAPEIARYAKIEGM